MVFVNAIPSILEWIVHGRRNAQIFVLAEAGVATTVASANRHLRYVSIV